MENPVPGRTEAPSAAKNTSSSKLFRFAKYATLGASMYGAWIMYMLLWNHSSFDYPSVIDLSFMFYDAERSGILHYNRIWWRGDSGMWDKTRDGRSLQGGFYDAGDTTKYGLPMAVSFSFLAWGLVDFAGGFRHDQIQTGRGIIRWGTDYLIKCHTGEYEFYAQVGNGEEEHRRWKRPEDILWKRERVGEMVNRTHPGSDVVGASAAAMASAAVVFKYADKHYAHQLIWRAQQLYNFGNSHQGKYSDHLYDARMHYPSTHYKDDLGWAAIWLYIITGQYWYVGEAKKHIDSLMYDGSMRNSKVVDWNFVGHPACVLLYRVTKEYKYRSCVEKYLDRWVYEFPRTPKGLTYVEMGTGQTSLRNTANTALVALMYAQDMRKFKEPMHKAWKYECWAISQIRYILGTGGRSLVVGYGNNPPKKAHHRGASCPRYGCDWWAYYSHKWNPHDLLGAVVGGPDKWDNFYDDRTNWSQSEVALDYNAGFTASVARINQIANTEGFERCYTGKGWA